MSKEKLETTTLNDILDELKTKEIKPEIIADNRLSSVIFANLNIARAIREANSRVSKWMLKRGKQLLGQYDEISLRAVERNLGEANLIRVLVDEALAFVLGHYGIAGSVQLEYRFMGYNASKVVRERAFTEWSKLIEGKLNRLVEKSNLDPSIARACALVGAIVTYKIQREGLGKGA
jgi:hypothetical protein